ncbi:MAG: SufD family Fe-S cluster assembly protein [Desulfurococcaceae archaeon]
MASREDAEKALSKPAPYGPDIDLSKYRIEEPSTGLLDSSVLDNRILSTTERVGINIKSIAYLQANETALYSAMAKALSKYGVIVKPLREALKEYEFSRKLAWSLVDPTSDKYTAAAYLYGGEIGYFIYVPPNTRVPVPIYSCLALIGNNRVQFAHNIVYMDSGAEAHVVTGCAIPHGVSDGVHIGISEFFVGKNARLTFTMIHAWAEGLHVRPRTVVNVDKGGEYVSYYVIYSPIGSLQTYPKIYLKQGAKAHTASVIASSGNGVYDVGSKIVFEEDSSSGESVSRVIARDKSKVYARADLEALETGVKGHIECLGLLLSNEAFISSIPIITSRKYGALLSHEAAIGLIAERELSYLMSKGFTEEEAKAVLIRGFMNIDVPIPHSIKREVDKILDIVSRYAVG